MSKNIVKEMKHAINSRKMMQTGTSKCKTTLLSMSDWERSLPLRVELSILAKFVAEEFIGCNNLAVLSISDNNPE